MIRNGLLRRSAEHRKLVNTEGGPLHKTQIVTSVRGDVPSPNAFLIEQPAGTVTRAHFHLNNQFQVVVGGSGTIGRSAVRPYIAQYVSAHTGYGPITPGAEGLSYLTLRENTDPGAQYLPELRGKQNRSLRQFQTMSPPIEPGSSRGICEMIAPADGMAAWMVSLEAGIKAEPPAAEGASSRYCVVVNGEMRLNDQLLPYLSIVWVPASEGSAFRLEAGPSGLGVIVLQFPQQAG